MQRGRNLEEKDRHRTIGAAVESKTAEEIKQLGRFQLASLREELIGQYPYTFKSKEEKKDFEKLIAAGIDDKSLNEPPKLSSLTDSTYPSQRHHINEIAQRICNTVPELKDSKIISAELHAELLKKLNFSIKDRIQKNETVITVANQTKPKIRENAGLTATDNTNPRIIHLESEIKQASETTGLLKHLEIEIINLLKSEPPDYATTLAKLTEVEGILKKLSPEINAQNRETIEWFSWAKNMLRAVIHPQPLIEKYLTVVISQGDFKKDPDKTFTPKFPYVDPRTKHYYDLFTYKEQILQIAIIEAKAVIDDHNKNRNPPLSIAELANQIYHLIPALHIEDKKKNKILLSNLENYLSQLISEESNPHFTHPAPWEIDINKIAALDRFLDQAKEEHQKIKESKQDKRGSIVRTATNSQLNTDSPPPGVMRTPSLSTHAAALGTSKRQLTGLNPRPSFSHSPSLHNLNAKNDQAYIDGYLSGYHNEAEDKNVVQNVWNAYKAGRAKGYEIAKSRNLIDVGAGNEVAHVNIKPEEELKSEARTSYEKWNAELQTTKKRDQFIRSRLKNKEEEIARRYVKNESEIRAYIINHSKDVNKEAVLELAAEFDRLPPTLQRGASVRISSYDESRRKTGDLVGAGGGAGAGAAYAVNVESPLPPEASPASVFATPSASPMTGDDDLSPTATPVTPFEPDDDQDLGAAAGAGAGNRIVDGGFTDLKREGMPSAGTNLNAGARAAPTAGPGPGAGAGAGAGADATDPNAIPGYERVVQRPNRLTIFHRKQKAAHGGAGLFTIPGSVDLSNRQVPGNEPGGVDLSTPKVSANGDQKKTKSDIPGTVNQDDTTPPRPPTPPGSR